MTVAAAEDGTKVAVINVMGSLFLSPAVAMFEVIDELVEEAQAQTPVILVDVHAEATSEKVALSRWLDGRVTAVVGTHTHVQTSDARVQPGGTAAITDAGMTGPHDSVIGVKGDQAIYRMRTGTAGPLRDRRGRRPDRRRARRVRRVGAALRRSSRFAFPIPEQRRRAARRARGRARARAGGERVELAGEVPVARGEPELGQDERADEQHGRAQPP